MVILHTNVHSMVRSLKLGCPAWCKFVHNNSCASTYRAGHLHCQSVIFGPQGGTWTKHASCTQSCTYLPRSLDIFLGLTHGSCTALWTLFFSFFPCTVGIIFKKGYVVGGGGGKRSHSAGKGEIEDAGFFCTQAIDYVLVRGQLFFRTRCFKLIHRNKIDRAHM